MLLLQSSFMYSVAYNEWKTYSQDNVPISCVYYLFSQRFLYLLKSNSYTEGEKLFSTVDKSSVGLHGFLKTPSFNVSQEGERRGIKAILNSKRLWRLEVSCVQVFFCMCCCFSYPFFNLLVNYFSLEAVAWTCSVKKLF